MARKTTMYSKYSKLYLAATAFSILVLPITHAQEWASVATVSGTLVNGAICDSDGTDIFCDGNNPTLSNGVISADGISVTGNITATGYVSATTFYGDGSNLAGVISAAAGSDMQVMYNNNGVLAGAAGLTFASTTNVVEANNVSATTFTLEDTMKMYTPNVSSVPYSNALSVDDALKNFMFTISNNSSYDPHTDVTGTNNALFGYAAGRGLLSGGNNTFVGANAGLQVTTGSNNVAIGTRALESVAVTANQNVAIGQRAGTQLTGNGNTIVGRSAGEYVAAGNVIVGYLSGYSGSYNTIVGGQAGKLTTGSNNIIVGQGAGNEITSNDNIAIGKGVMADITVTGVANIAIGTNIELPDSAANNQLNIGNLLFGTGLDGADTTLSSGNIGIGVSNPSEKLAVAGAVSASTFYGSGANLTNLPSQVPDWYSLTNIPVGVQSISTTSLTTVELGELQNIDSVTITNAQWGYLGATDQGVATTNDVAFANLTASNGVSVTGGISATGNVSANAFIGDGSLLTGVTASTAEALVNGTTSITIPTPNGLIAMDTNGSRAVTIDTSGNVGVGTSAPGAPLHISNINPVILIDETDQAVDSGIWRVLPSGGDLAFQALNDAMSASSLNFVLTRAGDVGIGTFAPESDLTIEGANPVLTIRNSGANNAGDGGVLRFGHNQSSNILPLAEIRSELDNGTAGSRAGHLSFFTSTAGTLSEAMVIDEDGNVGIGTTTPSRTLHVKGNSTLLEANSPRIYIREIDGTTTHNVRGITVDSDQLQFKTFNDGISTAVSTDYKIRSDGTGGIEHTWNIANSFAMRLDGSGNLGIGATTVNNALHIKKAAPQIRLERSADNANDMTLILTPYGTVGGSNHSFSLGMPGGSDYFHISSYDGTTTSRSIVVAGNGNVGIGATSPGLNLVVKTSANTTSAEGVNITSPSAGWLRAYPSLSAGSYNALVSSGDTGLIFSGSTVESGGMVIAPWSASKKGIKIDSNGNVGINTKTPSAALQIGDNTADASAMLVLGEAEASSETYLPAIHQKNVTASENGLAIGTRSTGGDIGFYTGTAASSSSLLGSGSNSLRMAILDDGNICGTDSAFEACSSDARLKKNINNFKPEGVLNDLAKLRPVTFMWNDIGVNEYGYDKDQERPGFIAQEVQEVFPEWVTEDNKGYLTVDDGEMRYMLLKAVQELKVQNDALRARVEALEAASE